jgi:hypothetical protein
LTEEDLEDITKECSADLLVSVDPTQISNINNPKAAQDTPGPSRTKKTKEMKKPKEVQDIDSKSLRTTSIMLDEEGVEFEQQQVEVLPPRDEAHSSKKRKVSPLKSSSIKKPRTPVTNMRIALTLDDFDFIVAVVNDASKEIIEKQEVKQEKIYR